MKFEKHLFISYAHLDNSKGWVNRFHTELEDWLSMRLGHQAVIWRDKKLHGDEIFEDEILAQFPKVAVLLCIVSPRYLESESCAKEISGFCEIAKRTAGLVVGNKSRVVKLIKAPLDHDDALPDIMKKALGYQFYELAEDGTPLELDPELFGPEMAQKFNKKVAKIAWELNLSLKLIEASGEANPIPAAAREKPAVYLAESTYDQRDDRDALETELNCHGYRVLPDYALSRDEATYIEEVKQLLAQCQLSVHLVGNQYGAVPDGPTDKSIIVLQNELAGQCSREKGLRRVIWLPEGVQPKQEEQKAFVRQLQTDAAAQFGADLITSKEIETIKNAIHLALKRVQSPPATALEAGDETGKSVYLICDERDRENTKPLRRFLRDRGFEVKLPVFDGDAATVRKENESLLQTSKSVFLFYGEGSEAWKRSVEGEVRKVRVGSAARFPLWTYVASPETAAKRDLIDMEEPRHLDGLAGLSENAVIPFVKEFERVHP